MIFINIANQIDNDSKNVGQNPLRTKPPRTKPPRTKPPRTKPPHFFAWVGQNPPHPNKTCLLLKTNAYLILSKDVTTMPLILAYKI